MASILTYAGVLDGHKDWVTCMQVSGDMLVTGSRDKRLVTWDLTATEEDKVGAAKRSMTGHSHFISDLAVGAEGNVAITSSWDGTLRLWNLTTGECQKRFVGHERDVQSVCLNKEEKRVYSGASDKLVRVWSVEGKEMGKTEAKAQPHRDWVSCVRTLQTEDGEYVVATGWDRTIRIWKATESAGLTGKPTILVGPEGVITKCATMNDMIVAIAKDGSIRRINVRFEDGELKTDEEVLETEYKNMHDVVLHPSGTAAFVAVDNRILVVDMSNLNIIADQLVQDESGATKKPRSLAIDSGSRLYVGETLGSVLVFDIEQ